MSEFVEFEGLHELQKRLREIAPQIKGNPLRNSVRTMAQTFQDKAEEYADRIDDEETRTNISLAMDKKLIPVKDRDAATAKGDSYEVYEVGPRRKDKGGNRGAWYAHFVEFGTAKQRAQPFMRPAFEASKDDAMRAFEKKLRTVLDSAVKRLNKGKK